MSPRPGRSAAPHVVVLALLVQALALPAKLLAMATSRAPYDPLAQTISDLGARGCTSIGYPSGPVEVCSPLHAVLNGSWVLAGIALVVAALGLARTPSPAGRGVRGAAVFLLAVTGVSTVACGLIPLDVDLTWHSLVSLPAILLGPAAAAMTLACWWSAEPSRARRRLCWLLGALPTLAAVAMLLVLDGLGVMGLLERIAVWVPLLALGALGWRGVRHGSS